MNKVPAHPPIPWPIEMKVLIACGYRCMRCKANVVGDEERRVVAVNPQLSIDAANAMIACIRCAAAHEECR